jgi:nucleotide-binding universal stress UspA family protein
MKDFLRSIVLATDGSEYARLAARAAVDLCEGTGADLHVVHVYQSNPTLLPAPVTILKSGLPSENAARLLEESVERIRNAGGEIEGAHLRIGRPAEEIAALAKELEADLVVVGARGKGATRRLSTGSVSEEVARTAPSPTLVVRGGEESWPPRAVIVGDDLSREAERAGELAAGIGGLFGAPVSLVLGFPSPGAYGHAEASRIQVSRKMFGEGGELLRRRAIRLEDLAGGRPAIKVSAGAAATIIQNTAGESGEPTLVAVGSRGLSALRRLAVGSVSTDVLRAASGPVLIFPSAAKDERTPEEGALSNV